MSGRPRGRASATAVGHGGWPAAWVRPQGARHGHALSGANEQIKQGFAAWRRRDLSGEELTYLFLDGHYEGVRLGSAEKEAILVAHGITKTGARRLLGVYLGCRESADSWLLVLRDLVGRKLPRRPSW